MLTEICGYLKNWFDIDEYHRKLPRLEGEFTISDGKLPDLENLLIKGQYFYIYGSFFNDGVHEYTDELVLKDETFEGLVQSMRIEPDFLKLVSDIEAWEAKYGGIDSTAMSPFNSESFGGYSYSKSNGSNESGGTGNAADPKSVFKSRLNRWRKL